jgi:glutathione synthase/RimK-type ligase-like ATP-grasp enzyme
VRTAVLVTFNLMPEGEWGGPQLLVDALADRGVAARWESWDDPAVDWDVDVVAVRSTWDYHRRLADFLGWARDVQRRSLLLNGADVFAWNADKSYLVELADLVPVVPTLTIDDADLVPGLERAFSRWGTVVVKPRTGAGGRGVVVAAGLDDWSLGDLAPGPWVVQPLVASVRTTGESAVFVLDGRAVTQVDKVPAAGEVRVHERYGGSSRRVPVDPARAAAAEDAVRVAAERLDADLAYARVDLMRWDDTWVVGELELIEPGLYLDVDPSIAAPFADVVAARVPR